MSKIKVLVLFFLLGSLSLSFQRSRKGSIFKGNRKRSKKSSLGPDLRKIKQGLKQLGADHKKMLGKVLFLGTVSNNQNGNLRWFLPLGVEIPS